MPTEIFEDTIDLQIELLETLPIQAGPAYPMPRLRKTGGRELRTFRTVILENAYLRVTLIPALGGRIWSIFDKRTGTEILPVSDAPAFNEGGRRGVKLDAGIALILDGGARLNDLGPVATMIEEGEEPAVWLAETSLAKGFSFHQRIALPHDRAELVIEARIQGRTTAKRYDGGLAIFCGEGTWRDGAFYNRGRSAGFGISTSDLFMGVRYQNGCLHFSRFIRETYIGTRSVDTWTIRLTPISGLDRLSGQSVEGAFSISDERVQVQVGTERRGHKLVLLAPDGRALEAPVDLYPEHVLEIATEAIGGRPKGLVLLNPAKEEVLRTPESRGEYQPASFYGPERDDLREFESLAGGRHWAYTQLGIKALKAKDFAKADALFERALMFNADDPLLWWEKGLVRRLVGPEEENPERLNAHYLAPLEPALRAEAFLSQPLDMGREKSPLLTPLEEMPEDFVEVACMLIERGLLDQASRWIDEALRHCDLAMLHVLMAYCLITGTRMDAQAAEHLASAARKSGPPYPWREVEVEAISTLLKRFPSDSHLQSLQEIVQADIAAIEE